jgi:hypothetical protein
MSRLALALLTACGTAQTIGPPTPPHEVCKMPVHVDAKARGAYFRKVESLPSRDTHGIRVVVKLPSTSFDASRNYVSPHGEDDYRNGPLDHPSVYVGGNAAGHEVDVGLTWDHVHGGSKRGRDDAAFRAFWRTTNERNEWHQPEAGSADDVYFRSGDVVVITLVEVGVDTLRIDIRKEGDAVDGLSRTFTQQGFGRGEPATFKRVSSIDQFTVDARGERVGLEGHDVLATHTTARGAQWRSVDLLDAHGNMLFAIACSNAVEVRGSDTAPRYDTIFTRSAPTANGSESVDIVP